MGLFRPYERSQNDNAASEAAPSAAEKPQTPTKKKVPTPTRREAEAARRERLNPTLSPNEQRQRDREAKAKSREEQWAKVDEQPGRVLLRDFLDSRRGIAQWWMPIVISALAIALFTMNIYPPLAVWATVLPYLALIALAIHVFLLWRQFKALHAQRLPKESLKGLLMYLVNRIISLRRFRVPQPRVKPGDEI